MLVKGFIDNSNCETDLKSLMIVLEETLKRVSQGGKIKQMNLNQYILY